MKAFFTPILLLLSLNLAYADGGSVIPGSCKFNQRDKNELNYALSGRFSELDSDSESEIAADVRATFTDFHFSRSTRAHTSRRHWDGISRTGETAPSLFDHTVFPGFFVVESLVVETINTAIALHIPPCTSRIVRGRTYTTYRLSITAGIIARVVVDAAAHLIITAYPVRDDSVSFASIVDADIDSNIIESDVSLESDTSIKADVSISGVTDIRNWINRLPFSVSIVNGENSDISFSLNVAEAKERSTWIPWVSGPKSMWKSIKVLGNQKVLYYIYQSGNTVWWSRSNQWSEGKAVHGDSSVNGRRTVTLTADGPYFQKW